MKKKVQKLKLPSKVFLAVGPKGQMSQVFHLSQTEAQNWLDDMGRFYFNKVRDWRIIPAVLVPFEIMPRFKKKRKTSKR